MHWHCPSCNRDEATPRDVALQRLRDLGRLKRVERTETSLLLEIARLAAGEIYCPDCGAAGMELRTGAPQRDDFGGKRCEVCQKSIDPERLEVFPDSKLCTACQRGDERGLDSAEPEYCPACGTPLQPVKSTVGVTRYRMMCPQCRR